MHGSCVIVSSENLDCLDISFSVTSASFVLIHEHNEGDFIYSAMMCWSRTLTSFWEIFVIPIKEVTNIHTIWNEKMFVIQTIREKHRKNSQSVARGEGAECGVSIWHFSCAPSNIRFASQPSFGESREWYLHYLLSEAATPGPNRISLDFHLMVLRAR